jgi:hypothetical protein
VRSGSSSQSSSNPSSSTAAAASGRAGHRAPGSGHRAPSSGLRVSGTGRRAPDSGLRAPGNGRRAPGSWPRAPGSWLPSAPGRRDLRVDCSGDACIVGHASGFAVGLSGPSDSDRSADVASRLRLPSPRRPLPLLELGLDLGLDRVLPLLLEVLCLGLFSSRRSLSPCKPLLPGCSSPLCLRRSPWGALRLCSALPIF